MTEITNENFEKMFPIIKDAIKHSSFIAVDTELTGLVYNKDCIPSLFDTTDQRYAKQRHSAINFIICQMGLSLYSKDQKLNSYHTKTYTFYLCPRYLYNRISNFAVDLSAIEFLSYNNFDFNKSFKNGLNYLNQLEEQDLRNNFDKHLSEIDFIESPLDYEGVSTQISDWLSSRLINNNCGNQLVLKCKPSLNPLVNHWFLQELRQNFVSVWVQQIGQRFVAKPIDQKHRKELLKDEQKERQQVIEQMVGFSSVFKCLIDSKRPIVGHNMIMDLLLIYHHFYKPLPKKLKDFKSSLNSIFPYIFDTKCILFNEKKNLIELSHIIKNRSLGDIYLNLLNDEIVNNFFGSPKIQQIQDDNHSVIQEYSPHNSGFDAFATAFVFIKIGHILLMKNNNDSDELQTHSWFEFLKIIEKHCNKINLIRATTHYLCLSDSDPKVIRPKWLFARKRDKNSNFSMSKLTSALSANGTSDIRVIGDNSVLIAVNSRIMSKTILDAFRYDSDIKVTEYNVYKHNKSIHLFLWTTFTLSTSITAILTLQLIKCFKH